MKNTHPPLRPLARRVSIVGSLVLVAALLAVSLYMSVDLTRRERERIAAWVGEKAQGIAEGADAFDATSRLLVDKFYTSFAGDFGPDFALDKSDGTLSNGGEKLNGDFGKVDAFARKSGGNATIFARQGDDFVRVSTSVTNEKGERAVGTKLAHESPAYAQMLAGKTYIGRTTLFGKPFMTRYEPIRQGDEVIGILYIGFDLSAFQSSFETLAADTKFFESGGVYVIDPKKAAADAVFVAHPSAKGRKVAEAFPGGEAFLAALDKAGDDELDHALPVLRPGADDSFVLVRRSKATGWWIVAEVSEHEAMRAHWAAMTRIWIMMAAAALVLGVGLQWMIRRWVARPLRQLSEAVARMAEGDMTRACASDQPDEIGRLVRDVDHMRVRLLHVLKLVRQSAESVATGSSEIALGNTDLSQRTEEQAASLQQTAAAMGVLTTAIGLNSQTAHEASTIADGARDAAARGGQVVGDVVARMQEIAESSRRIGSIIGVIDGLSFQTNILALNAAVEAARAGEQGRGFAVVASEVRSLAQRSAEAAREIKVLVGASVERVEAGVALVDDAGRSMAGIVGEVDRVSALIERISVAGGEQAKEIGQVGEAVRQLDVVTQRNAALVEESAAAADSLKEQAARLVDAAGVFRLSTAA
jgi:methyl-accepting chemotaxis protein-2 (aspartate sensor receptor)